MTRDECARTNYVRHGDHLHFCHCDSNYCERSAIKYKIDCFINRTKMERIGDSDYRNITEKRTFVNGNSSFLFSKFVYILYICLLLVNNSGASEFNSCDFIGSGLDMDIDGVQPVYLSCSAGRITWQYPRAALRIIFRLPTAKNEFRGCIKAAPKIEGARIFIEGHRTLIPLYAQDDTAPRNQVRCFTSYKGQVALYFEAEPPVSGFTKQVAAFEYDLQPLTKGEEIYDPMEDCRPCSDSELIKLYCSANFAAKGTIIETKDDIEQSRTIVTFAAAKVFQQTAPVFSISATANREADAADDGDLNALSSNDLTRRYTGTLYVPLHCGAKAGPGQFLVLGTVRLGEPILKCAPRIEDWRRLVRTSKGDAHCVLET